MASSIYIQAAVLGPRFKKLSFLTDEQKEEGYTAVKTLAESMDSHRTVREESPDHDSDSDLGELTQRERTTAHPKQKERDLVVSMLMDVDKEERNNNQTKSVVR